MDTFIINGGNSLSGEASLCGAKNSGFKLMIASLYSDTPCTIHNFSKIGDIISTAQIIKELGGRVVFGQNHILKVCGQNLKQNEFSQNNGRLSRASTYFIGPLLYRFGKAILPIPGGCPIGRRPLDRHLEGLKALGADIKTRSDHYEISASKLQGINFKFNKNTHGGTDIMIIAASIASGVTILENAAEEPEIDDLIAFLNKMGARIKRENPRKIIIEGVKHLKSADHTIMPDRNEAVTFACAALATQGDIFVKNANQNTLGTFLEAVKNIGGGIETDPQGIRFFHKGHLTSTNITTAAYPGFMTDWMALWTLLMTQAKGESIIFETIFENRFAFVSELQKMNADITLFNPEVKNPENVYNFNLEDDKPEYFHAARVKGPTILKGTNQTISDLRAGATLILASLIAKGQSEILGAEHVDRGYENLDGRLKSLGADIQRVS